MGNTQAVETTGQIDVQGNPASTTFITRMQGQAGLVNHLVDINGYSLAGVLPLENHRLSAELIYFDYGLFDKTDEFGNTYLTFGFHELAFQAGYAFRFSEKLRLGVRSGLYERHADGNVLRQVYTSFGGLYHLQEDSLTYGLYLSNKSIGDTEEDMPTTLIFGTSKILAHLPLRLNIEGHYELGGQWLLATGGEILIHPDFTLRLGLNTHRFDLQTGVNQSDFIAGVSGGFLLKWHGFLIESAMQSLGAAGVISQLAFGYSF